MGIAWKLFPLSEVCEINPGKKEFQGKSKEIEVSFLPMAGVSEDGKILTQEKRKLKEVIKGYTNFQDGDVLLAKITPCFENGKRAVAKNLTNGVGFGSTEFHVLRPGREVTSDWIFHAISRSDFCNIAKSQMTGTAGQKRVPTRVLEQFKIPIPSIKEQERISENIETQFTRLDAVIKSLELIKTKLKACRQSLLRAAFQGKLTSGIAHWCWSSFASAGKWTGGGTPSKSKPEFWRNGSVLWVSPKDMKSKVILDTIDKITDNAIKNSSAKLVTQGSLLFVVRSGIIRRTLPIAIAGRDLTLNQDLQAFTPNEHVVTFLYWFTQAYNDEIRRRCSKSGTTVESIETSLLKAYQIPSCSVKEQSQIVSIIESHISIIEKVEIIVDASLLKAEKLRKSILKTAFEGKLAN